VVKWQQIWSKGCDGMEIIDSNNKMYLIKLKQITVDRDLGVGVGLDRMAI
jgi:hypothetical protein